MRRTEEAEAHFTIFVHLLAVWRETSWPGRSPHHPPPRAIKPPTRSKQPRDLRSTLDLQKENIASRMEGTMAAVAHSPLLTTPINHLNSGLACCPTHAKDGRSARLEGRLFLDHFARTADHGGAGWEGGREGLRRASTPFQTDDHSCENGREEGTERTRRTEGGANAKMHARRRKFPLPSTHCLLPAPKIVWHGRGIGQNDSHFGLCPTAFPLGGRNAQGRRERTGTITNASNLDTNPM